MSPWTIIGWALVLALAVAAMVVALCAWDLLIYPWLVKTIMHRRTRKIAPRPWQVWVQDNKNLTILPAPDGKVCISTHIFFMKKQISTNGAEWVESIDDWNQRVRNRRLWLLKELDE